MMLIGGRNTRLLSSFASNGIKEPAKSRILEEVMAQDSLLLCEWEQVGEDIAGDVAGFGQRMSMSADGSIVAVAAKKHDASTGQVRVFERGAAGSWDLKGDEIPGDAPGDEFGSSVDLSYDGRTVAIGARRSDGNGNESGNVQIFQFDVFEDKWVQLGEAIDGEEAGDWSGGAVSISADGSVVAIGAKFATDQSGERTGHVRVFQQQILNETLSWRQMGADIEGGQGSFGFSVSLSSDGLAVAVGAPADDNASGRVRVFTFDPDGWAQVGQDLDGSKPGDEFGSSVWLNPDGRTLAAGSPAQPGNEEAVRIYTLDNDGKWKQLGGDLKLGSGNLFGVSVALSEDGKTAVIGAPNSDNQALHLVGNLRVFRYRDNFGWLQIGQVLKGSFANHNFGETVAISADGTIVGGGGSGESGLVEIFKIDAVCLDMDPDPSVGNPNENSSTEKGIVVGGIVTSLVILAAAVTVALIRRRRKKRRYQNFETSPPISSSSDPFNTSLVAVPVQDEPLPRRRRSSDQPETLIAEVAEIAEINFERKNVSSDSQLLPVSLAAGPAQAAGLPEFKDQVRSSRPESEAGGKRPPTDMNRHQRDGLPAFKDQVRCAESPPTDNIEHHHQTARQPQAAGLPEFKDQVRSSRPELEAGGKRPPMHINCHQRDGLPSFKDQVRCAESPPFDNIEHHHQTARLPEFKDQAGSVEPRLTDNMEHHQTARLRLPQFKDQVGSPSTDSIELQQVAGLPEFKDQVALSRPPSIAEGEMNVVGGADSLSSDKDQEGYLQEQSTEN